MTRIELIPELSLDESALAFSYIRASGPGGQNVNKVSTAVQLRCDLGKIDFLSEAEMQRLQELCKNRINGEGELVIEAHSFRTQEQNRQSALRRLGAFLEEAKAAPRIRIPTKPHKAGGGGGGSESTRRSEEKRIRFYDPDEWGE